MSDAASTPLPLTLEWLPGTYAVCRLDPSSPIPSWVEGIQVGATPPITPTLVCITRTDRELSIVIDQSLIPPDPSLRVEREFVALRIVGIVDFSLVGIFAKLTGALAAASIPVFVISTFDTDILMIRSMYAERATAALRSVAAIGPR